MALKNDGSWNLSWWTRTVLVILSLSFTEAYRLKYFDCGSSKLIHRYPVSTACSKPLEENATVLHMDLLQKIDYSESPGWSCEKKVSRFKYYCGYYGHFKVLEVPEIEISVTISPEDCRKYVNSKKYRTTDGASHMLQVPGETILSMNEKGVIHEKGSISCDGEKVKINNAD